VYEWFYINDEVFKTLFTISNVFLFERIFSMVVQHRNFKRNTMMKCAIFRLSHLLAALLMVGGEFLFSQSISGNLNHNGLRNISYANVDIYKDDKLIASTFTDADGNYSVKLDTGIYRIEFQYAGFERVIEEITVESDVTLTRNLTENKSDKYYRPLEDREKKAEEAKRKMGDSRGYGKVPMHTEMIMEDRDDHAPVGISHDARAPLLSKGASGSPYTRDHIFPTQGVGGLKNKEIRPGQLTAGEINDFSKWKMWNDLAENELSQHQKFWQLAPMDRFSVQVTDGRRQPLVNALAELVDESGNVVAKSKTDNTGKTELWAALVPDSPQGRKYAIRVNYAGWEQRIRKAKPFHSGINKVVFEVNCGQNFEVDIAFVVDATGSMSDELNFLKAELNDVIYQSKLIDQRLNFRFANVFYRDHGDAYLTRTQQFSRILSESITFITDQHAGGGGDYEEAVEVALDTAIHQLSWNPTARARIIFLILDAPPHNTPQIQVKLQQLMRDAADKGIRIVPLVASGINKSGEYLMRTLALATNGTYAFLTNHSGIGNTKIEPSTDSYEVELLNDLLIRIIGNYTFMPNCEDEAPEMELDLPDSLVVIHPNQDHDTLEGVGNLEPTISWRYWPNPTNGIVNIEVDADVKELFITDMNGKILHRLENIKANRAVQTDLSAFSTGIYLVRYPLGKQWVSGKIVLVRS
jgi:hypothetical protein